MRAKLQNSKTSSMPPPTQGCGCKTWSSGASYNLKNKEEMRDWITAFQARYYEHLAQSGIHKDNILVSWKNEKGDASVEEENGGITFLT